MVSVNDAMKMPEVREAIDSVSRLQYVNGYAEGRSAPTSDDYTRLYDLYQEQGKAFRDYKIRYPESRSADAAYNSALDDMSNAIFDDPNVNTLPKVARVIKKLRREVT